MKRHTVHTKHPRYRVPKYPRGKGRGVIQSESVEPTTRSFVHPQGYRYHWSEEHMFSGAIQQVWMTPRQFLELSTPPPLGGFGQTSVNWHTQNFKTGSLEALTLHAEQDTGQVRKHNGRHRAMSAYLLGIRSLPVEVYHMRPYVLDEKGTIDPDRFVPDHKYTKSFKLKDLKSQAKGGATGWDYAKRGWFHAKDLSNEEIDARRRLAEK